MLRKQSEVLETISENGKREKEENEQKGKGASERLFSLSPF